jgi:hypothetical protein
MEKTFKVGRCIIDKQVKFTKNYFRANPISYEKEELSYFELKDCVIKITNLRKYKSNFDLRDYEFEADIIVDTRYNGYAYSNRRMNVKKRMYNQWYRYKFQERIMEELKYFGVEYVTINKITYQEID